jgi:transcriptional regulator with XRE-family HTH domain
VVPSPLRLARLERGLAQATVAEAIGVGQAAVSLVELGQRLCGPAFTKLAAYYDRSPDTLRRRMVAWRRQVAIPRPQAPSLVRSTAQRTAVA